MSGDKWETVTDLTDLSPGEALRVLGEENWTAAPPGARNRTANYMGEWIFRLCVGAGQVERRAEPKLHPDDVETVIEHMPRGAIAVIRALDRQRRARGEQ